MNIGSVHERIGRSGSLRNDDDDGNDNGNALITSRLIRTNVGKFVLELNSRGLQQSSGKEKESCCHVFWSSTILEIRHFHVVVVQRLQRNVQKSVMHVQSCFLLI